jgi:hypothetical protein
MSQQGEANLQGSDWNAMVPSLAEVPNFEALYEVPATHRLVPVRSRSRGGLNRAEYWTHEEYDPLGRLVACYDNFEEVDAAGRTRSGWRKLDIVR